MMTSTTMDTTAHTAVDAHDGAAMRDLLQARAETYGFLARLYRKEVDEALLQELRAARFPTNTGDDEVDKGYALIAGYLARTAHDTNVLTELAVDYARTFIGHGVDGRSAAYPFESVYTSGGRLLMQDARDEVLHIYRAHGLDKDASWPDCEDHIALELEYMNVLAGRAVTALESGDEAQTAALLADSKAFLDAHLANWVPMFAHDMYRFSQNNLYHGLAHLTEGFLRVDGEFLAELPGSDA